MAAYDSLHSLLDYECLLFHCDWLGSDLRISHFFYCDCLERRLCYEWIVLSLMLWPTASRPVYLGIKHPSGAYDQNYISVRQLRVCWCGTLSDERTGLSVTIAAGPRQLNHNQVRVPWDSRPYFIVSDSRLPFSSPPTTRRAAVDVFDPASARDNEWMNRSFLHVFLYSLARIHGKCLLLALIHGNRCWFRWYGKRFPYQVDLHESESPENMVSESLFSNGLFRLSGVM
jgi:hypothetical protein